MREVGAWVAGTGARIVVTGERRLAAVALADRLGDLGVRAEVRAPTQIEGQVPPRRPVAILVAGWSAGLQDMLRRLASRGHQTIVLPFGPAGVDRVRAMRSGATDVIPSGPQQAEELALKLARLFPVSARESPSGEQMFRVGPYTFDPVRQQLLGDGRMLELTPTQSVLLYCLLHAALTEPERRLRAPDLIGACRLPGLTPGALRKQVFELRARLERDAGLQVISGDLRMGLACRPEACALHTPLARRPRASGSPASSDSERAGRAR